jgi:hypothetical protein
MATERFMSTNGSEPVPVSRANEHAPNAIGANDILITELVWTDNTFLIAELTTYGGG